MKGIKVNIKQWTKNPERIWITSDSHYSHRNIVKGVSNWSNKDSCRDFETVEQMNDVIVSNYNVVPADDLIIHHGDFSFGGIEQMYEFASRIKCKNIILVRGNHDNKIDSKLFLQVFSYFEFVVNSKLFCSFHYPIKDWNEKNRGSIHIFGHSHQFENNFEDGKSMNVGLEANNMKVWNLTEIIKIMESVPVSKTHHEGNR